MDLRALPLALACFVCACASRVRPDDVIDVVVAEEPGLDATNGDAALADALDAVDAPIDAPPRECSTPLAAVPGTILLRPVPGYETHDAMPAFRARAENAAGDVIEVDDADGSGLVRIVVGDRPGPWDVTLARAGWHAVSILGLEAPHASDVVVRFGFARDVRPDPIPPPYVFGTVSGWSSTWDTAWLTNANDRGYSFSMTGCEPFRFGAVEFDLSGVPRNAVLSPWIQPVQGNIALDLAFPSTPPPRRHSVVTVYLPPSGILSQPSTMSAIATRSPDDSYRLQRFGATQVALNAVTHALRIDVDYLGDGFEPDGLALSLQDSSSSWASVTRLETFADGASATLTMPGELDFAGTTVDDYTMQIDAAGFDDVVFRLQGATAQDHGGWAVFATPAALATMRHWPRLPSGMTAADLMGAGYPEYFAESLRVCAQQRANGVVPWGQDFSAPTRHAVCRRVATR